MASKGDSWGDAMQSRLGRIVMNAIPTVICAAYAVAAVRGIITPNQDYLESLGTVGYYALQVAQTVVCVWVVYAMGKHCVRALLEKGDEDNA